MKKTILAAGLALLAACGGPSSLYYRGVKPLNENDRKESNSVDIRIYQLKDDARFNQATIDKLWSDDKERSVELGELPEAVRFVGVLALYPKEDDKGPRKLLLPKSELGTVLRFTGYHIQKEK